MMNLFAENAAFQPALVHVRCNEVRDLFEKVSLARMSFRFYAKFAQTLYPPPDSRARDANLPRDSCAADDDRRVFGEKRYKSRNAAVCCASNRSICLRH